MSVWKRIKAAAGYVVKGSSFPFNKFGPDSVGGKRLESPYTHSVWVQRAIKKVAGPIAAVSLQLSLDGRGGKQALNDRAVMEFWKRPAAGLSYSDFIEATVTWLKLKGESFWILDQTWVASATGKMPWPEAGRSRWSPLIVARPDRMVERVSGGQLVAWEYTDGSSVKHMLPPEQVIHCKYPNPYDEWRGLAEMDAARIAAESDYLAGMYARNVMRNNGDRGPYIVAKEGIPDQDQQKQLIEQLREKRELNQRGIFKPFFVSGNISVEDPKAQAVDAAFLAQRLGDRHEVFIAFGVPPSMADKMESYSVGSASDWYVLIFETCIPTAAKIADCIERVASMQTGKDVFARCNFDEHPVMQQVRKENVDTLVKLAGPGGMGLPVQAANEYLSLGLPEFEGWELPGLDREQEFKRKVWLGFQMDGTVNDAMANLTGIRQLTEEVGLPVNPEYEEPYFPVLGDDGAPVSGETILDADGDIVGGAPASTEQKPVDGGDKAAQAEEKKEKVPVEERTPGEDAAVKAIQRREVVKPSKKGAHGKSMQRQVDAFKTVLSIYKARRAPRVWKTLDKKRGPVERAIQNQINHELAKARQEVLSKLGNAKAITKAAAADFMFSLERFQQGILAGVRKEAVKALDLFGQQVFDEINRDDPWKMPPREVTEFLEQRESPLKDASEEIWKGIREGIQESIDAGDTMEQIAERIRGEFNGMSRERSEVIAQTETAIAYGVGRQKAMESAGVTHKQWLTSGNDNVRDAHRAANGQVKAIGEAFVVGGEELMHPGDPSGSAANIINCRCVCIAVATEGQS